MAAFSMSSFMIIVLLASLLLPLIVESQRLPLRAYRVPSGGAESFAFDREGRFYIGVNDGRILRFHKHRGFLDFAYTAPNRTKKYCDGKKDFKLGWQCGRPFGLAFHHATNQLYIADGYYGLLVVGPKGGLATQILSSCEGKPFKFLDGIDVDQTTGKVYLTDVSTKHSVGGYFHPKEKGIDSSGRVMEYDPSTKAVRVLASRLKAPAGIAVCQHSASVLFSTGTTNEIHKYWLRGPKANTTQVVMNVSRPDNVVTANQGGHYWVASSVVTNTSYVGMGVKMDENGKTLRKVVFESPFQVVSEVHEFRGHLYVACVNSDYIGICKL